MDLSKWLNKELSALLECEVGEEYSQNILKIQTEPELREFIGSLLDLSIHKNKAFLDELTIKMNMKPHLKDITVYKKPDLEESTNKSKSNKKKSNKIEIENLAPVKKEDETKNFSLKAGNSSKEFNRRPCDCQAYEHSLIGNCQKCGRIVCSLEGSGPCYFCGNLVCTREEFEKISRSSKKSENLKSELLSRNWNVFALSEDIQSDNAKETLLGLKKAIEHKNKLVDYDRTSTKRTKVIDDESDYFNTNSKWLSQKQKLQLQEKEEDLRDKKYGSKSNKTFTFDFAGRKVVNEQPDLRIMNDEIDKILNEKAPKSSANKSNNHKSETITPKFVETKPQSSVKKIGQGTKQSNFRLQDQDLQQMRDEGMCLSMHQPWASLLVLGIKRHEGRSWYTPFRGRLYIHAGSKQPSDVDIKEVEQFYRCYYKDQEIEFPQSYPTSCLLGYIDLSDCLNAEAYKETYPDGESESEFVFICTNPNEFVVKIPMSGQHKIFKLDKTVHQVAKKTSVITYNES